jgi:hypothetical protein
MKRLQVVQAQLQSADDMLVAMRAYVELIEADTKEYFTRAVALKAVDDKVSRRGWFLELYVVTPRVATRRSVLLLSWK